MQISILLLFSIGCISIISTSLRIGISPTPSSNRAKRSILRLSHLYIEETGTILELGAGWGTLAFPLAEEHPRHRIFAYEQSLLPWLWMKLRQFIQKQPNLSIIRGNFLKHPLGKQHPDIALIVCYLFTKGMLRLQEKSAQELPQGIPIISNTFSFPTWKPIDQENLNDLYQTKIYVYKNTKNHTHKEKKQWSNQNHFQMKK